VHLELVLVGLDQLAEGLPVPGLRTVDQIRGHDRIPASLNSQVLHFFPQASRLPLTGMDTVRAANRALVGRPFCRPARVYPVEGR
jgi:hypothetical protein